MDGLIPIGRFSSMTRLSVKALRHYGELGLLDPAFVDPMSGYRYYRPGQANLAEAIRILRRVDMPLNEIKEVLSEEGSELTRKRLAMHRERLEERLADQARILRYLQGLIDGERSIMPYEVAIKNASTQDVAAIKIETSLAKIGEDIGRGFGAVIGAMGGAGVQPAGMPFLIYHDVIDEQTDGDIEVCVPVPPGSSAESGEVKWKEIPGGPVASTVHQGPYDQIAPAYHTLTGWIQEHGHEMTGPPREIYLNDPEEVAPEDLLTEVQWPIDGEN